jgi:hypothetical protein
MKAFIFLSDLNPFWDPNIMNAIDGIKSALSNGNLVTTAQMIAAVLSLIYISIKAYAMIVGEGRFDLMSLLRPFVVTLLIVNFSTYVNIVSWPGQSAGNSAQSQFESNVAQINLLMDQRDALYQQTFSTLISLTISIQKQNSNTTTSPDDNIFSRISNSISSTLQSALDDINSHITMFEYLSWMKLTFWVDGILTTIALSCFKGIAYCIFFLQMIIMHVMAALGPISFAFSIAGSFRENWASWTARFIAVSFYTYIGFLVLNIASTMIYYGAQQEVSRLTQLLAIGATDIQAGTATSQTVADFAANATNIQGFLGYIIIGVIVAITGVIATPVISTWIIQTAGAGQAFFGGASRTVESAISGAASTAKATAGAAAAII